MADKYPIDAKVILDPLDSLVETFLNKIEREWPRHVQAHPDSPLYLRGFVAIAKNLFRTMRYFCADKDRDKELERRLEFTKSAPPLARVVLEILYNTTFMLEDLPGRTTWFEKAAWSSMREELEHREREFGNDPDWADHLKRFQNQVERGVSQFNITPEEQKDPGLIPYWPTPGKMANSASPELASYFRYLDAWFYGNLS